MIPALREDFNRRFTPAKYAELLRRLDQRSRTHVDFRQAETPCFFPKSLLHEMCRCGVELTHMLVDNPQYMQDSAAAIPDRFRVPNEPAKPLFMTVDFGLVREASGKLTPKLVELQAFPSIYGYQALACEEYRRVFELDPALNFFLNGDTETAYWDRMRQVIVGDHDPENVVLSEIDPAEQKTLPDFNVTEDHLGIRTVDIAKLIKQGSSLFYRDQNNESRLIPIHRIYNRAIVDELLRKQITLPFDYRDQLDVEWAGHPNWYFRVSKFSLPYLKHSAVPTAVFLDELDEHLHLLPEDRNDWILKPLYSFAGKGIEFAPTDATLDAIPLNQRHEYLIQERVNFEPVIATPEGATQAEIRILYLWPDGQELTPVISLVRMGRGKMMGVDHNRDRTWVGGSAAFFPAQ